MNSALIGHSGFVGSNLKQRRSFTALYNSKNIQAVAGKTHDLVICAAAPATMWAANRDPAADKANLASLTSALSKARIGRFVLISTIAVFDDAGAGYTEEQAQYEKQKAYGRHRRELEVWAQEQFERCHIIRLPALFGRGLKKNFIFDLQNPVPTYLSKDRFQLLCERMVPSLGATLTEVYSHDPELGMYALDHPKLVASGEGDEIKKAVRAAGLHAATFTNSSSEFQLYHIDNLGHDIDRMIDADISVLNLAVEPISAAAIAKHMTGQEFHNDGPAVYKEDMRSCYARTLADMDDYIYSDEQIVAALDQFAQSTTA